MLKQAVLQNTDARDYVSILKRFADSLSTFRVRASVFRLHYRYLTISKFNGR